MAKRESGTMVPRASMTPEAAAEAALSQQSAGETF
jgi:hypothetical protein